MQLMREEDPEGVRRRKHRRLKRRVYRNKVLHINMHRHAPFALQIPLFFMQGPNYMWHVDAYDKLKPYGISISGCIDG